MANNSAIEVVMKLKESVFQNVSRQIRDRAGAAMYQFGEAVMTEAKTLCPVDTGTLRSSGHVKAPVFAGNDIEITLGFGGASAPYAAIVHEDLTAKHPSGQAKYLELPAIQNAPRLGPFVANAIKGAF